MNIQTIERSVVPGATYDVYLSDTRKISGAFDEINHMDNTVSVAGQTIAVEFIVSITKPPAQTSEFG